MIRRLAVAIGVLVATTGCTTFTDGDAVARVNDTELSADLLDDLTSVLGPQAAAPSGTGTNADAARTLIAQWIQVAVVEEHLAEIGVEITAEAEAEARAQIEGDPGLADISDGARTYLLDAQAVVVTFNQLPDPQASFEAAIDGADIHVDARYGSFDPEFGVLPIGLGPVPTGF